MERDEFSSRYADFINIHEFSFILKIYNHPLELGAGLEVWARVRFRSHQFRGHMCM